jgi:branched-chain amino acid transport system permease protein
MDIEYLLQMVLNAILAGSIYSLIALGFTLIFGIARVVNFAHGEMYMMGGFIAYYSIVKWHMPFLVGVVIASLGMAVVGIVLEKALFRPIRLIRPLEMDTETEFPTVVVALALGLIFPSMAVVMFGTTEKGVPSGIEGVVSIGPTLISKERLVIAAIGLALFLGLLLFIRYHREGRALNAVAQDRVSAILQGINLDRASSMSFAIGLGLAGAAGGLLAPLYYVDAMMGPPALLKTFIVVILGGIGSVPATLLGGLLFGFIEVFGRITLGGNLPMLISFLLVMVFLIIRPRGILGHD